MRRLGLTGVLVGAFFLLAGMGGGGDMPSSDTIPRPKERFTGDLIDRQGVTTRATYLACAGKTFFPLKRGEGILMVPFTKLVRVKFGAEKDTQVEATFQIEGGKELQGRLPHNAAITGATDYGNYQIELRGLREIVFVRQ
ncbi:MAG: hypothetical protein HY900_13245 [Deltaproteobacteria bacterium]|nr:hypothetical protein [Deltaproteobacteria bacterium]